MGEAWSCVITDVNVHLIFLGNNVTSGALTCNKSSVLLTNLRRPATLPTKGGALLA